MTLFNKPRNLVVNIFVQACSLIGSAAQVSYYGHFLVEEVHSFVFKLIEFYTN